MRNTGYVWRHLRQFRVSELNLIASEPARQVHRQRLVNVDGRRECSGASSRSMARSAPSPPRGGVACYRSAKAAIVPPAINVRDVKQVTKAASISENSGGVFRSSFIGAVQ